MTTYKTSDGFRFYLQADGRLTDHRDANLAGDIYESLEQFLAAIHGGARSQGV